MNAFGGFIIGLLAGGVATITIEAICKYKNDGQPLQGSQKPYVPAEIVVRENLGLISPLLKGVSKKGIINNQDWTEAIISINNDELTDIWKASNNRPELWMTYLQTFGFQIDYVDTFEAAPHHSELYDDMSGEDLAIGQMYKVMSYCWIYTDDNNEKSVACKGLVSKL